jgi:hypothetical protein
MREIMSKNRKKNLRSFVVWILGPAMLLGSSAVSLAVQQGEPVESPQGETIERSKPIGANRCTCVCIAGTLSTEGYYYTLGHLGCYGLEDKTCNIEDPKTGGIRGGKLAGCSPKPVKSSGDGGDGVTPSDGPTEKAP